MRKNGPIPVTASGPQCDSAQHEQLATGQAVAALGLGN
jgi:hypothetical protein